MVTETDPTPAADHEVRSRSVPLWLVVLAVLALGGVVELIIYGYLERPGWIGVANKRFWDYLDLLIVPGALALGVYWLNRRQDERDQQAEEDRRSREVQVENERAQDAAVQAYLDQLTQLLLTQRDQDLLRMQVDDEVRQVIKARSEPLLRSVSVARRWSLIQFLSLMGLLRSDEPLVRDVDLKGVSLRRADLKKANLEGANFEDADLQEANLEEASLLGGANLRRAALNRANLSRAQLGGAELQEANLEGANLQQANLAGAYNAGLQWYSRLLTRELLDEHPDMRVTNLEGANLAGADLRQANLRFVNLQGADLQGADLQGADLLEARVTDAQLANTLSLQGATMPDGQVLKGNRHPDGPTFAEWVKSR
jgi:uncharacterized protein YjbI with pentapeptide repeats